MDGILILAATNMPWALDSAIRRRFDKRIYIPLPDESARAKVFEIHLGNTPSTLTKEDFKILAKESDGYSGSDIAVVVKEAIMEPIRIVQNATHFKKVIAPDRQDPSMDREYWQPCSPGDKDAVEMTWVDIDSDSLKEPDVSMVCR